MKYYRASEIIKRAMQIADIENTDFLQHKEITQYLNDSWQKVYQWLINKGDKQFIEEVKLSGGGFGSVVEYDLPSNFYQMCSLRTPSGYVVNRKSESESDNSGTYEIVNNKLRLYGCAANLTLTYWVTPIWITYPDKDIEVESLDGQDPNKIIAHCKNSVVDENGQVYNAYTGERVAVVNVDMDNGHWNLGKGHVSRSTSNETLYYAFNGDSLGRFDHEYSTQSDFNIDNKVCYMANSSCVMFMNTKIGEVDFTEENCIIGGDKDVIFNHYGEFRISWMLDNSGIDNYVDGKLNIGFELIDVTPLGNMTYLFMVNKGQFVYVHIYPDGTYEYDVIKSIGKQVAPLEYGPLTYTGEYTLSSAYPDTIFNFPNEIYVSLIAADLASRFLMKMNADSTGVDNLYATMQRTFMNTLTQDGNYTRIQNVYRS